MRRIEKEVGMPIWLTMAAFAVSFFSLSAIPFTQHLTDTGQKISGYIIAAVFWLFLLIGLLIVFFTKERQQTARRKLKSMGLLRAHQPPGIISFSISPLTVTIYLIFLIGFIVTISDIILHWVPGYIMFPIFSITLFAFMLHCVIDGENYKVYQVIKKGLDQNHERNKDE